MRKKSHILTYEESIQFLKDIERSKEINFEIRSRKEKIVIFNEAEEEIFKFRPPLPFPSFNLYPNLNEYIKNIPKTIDPYIIILIQSGSASLGFCVNGEIKKHKVINKYMKRMKQGKSQISYLKTKGKSRAGSRIRLEQTGFFFKEINEKLIEWLSVKWTEKIFISCPITLWSYWNNSFSRPPFPSKGQIVKKIPFSVRSPNHNELKKINFMSLKGEILYDERFDLIEICKKYNLDKVIK